MLRLQCLLLTRKNSQRSCLDILEKIDPEIAFIPGLDHCCGDCHIWYGNPDQADTMADKLLEKIAGFNPEILILWCPTCQCRLEKTFAPTRHYSFEILSLPQFLSRNLDKLSFTATNNLHVMVKLKTDCRSRWLSFSPACR